MSKERYYTFDDRDIFKSRWWMGVFSYGLPLSLIMLFVYAKKSKFVYYHAKQGAVQFVFFLLSFLSLYIPKVGELIFLMLMLLNFSISVTGIVLFIRKEICEFPILGSAARHMRLLD